MKGLFISFEGTEACGKSTQAARLAERLRALGWTTRELREPGGTAIGEEIRHTFKHSAGNRAMTPEAELLLLNASRAQLVREIIRPALARGEIVLCDRFYDSTVAYQGYGRGLDLKLVAAVVDFAIGGTRPDLTLFLNVSPETSRARMATRELSGPKVRDRMEEEHDAFFARVTRGYAAIAAAERERVREIDAGHSIDHVANAVWQAAEPLVARLRGGGGP